MGALKKTLYFIVFDVSGSMYSPLKLRSNAEDADKGSRDLEPKRVHTVFDIITQLAENSVDSAKHQEISAAVLAFGLRHVNTCDLLALMEERTKVLELLDMGETTSHSGLSYSQVTSRLVQYGISSADAHLFVRQASHPNDYTVVGRQPLVQLLANAGAPYCESYVEEHLSPELAGKYFVSFSAPERARDLHAIVDRLPEACKTFMSPTRWATNILPGGSFVQGYAAREAIDHADRLLANSTSQTNNPSTSGNVSQDVQTILRSIPIAKERPLNDVIQLLKRVQKITEPNKQQTGTSVNWERILNDIEPYLYGGTPMCEALRISQPCFLNTSYSSKVMVLISDGGATDGDPRFAAQSLRDSGGVIFSCLLTDNEIREPRRLFAVTEVETNWPSEAVAMFDMASTISCDSGAVQTLRRKGWKLPTSGKCKLFVQANNPLIIDEFVTASRKLGTSSDALAGMIGEISLDDYISQTNDTARATNQEARAICWAHATASVFHLASHRVVGREVASFMDIRAHLLNYFGDNDDGQDVNSVLRDICPMYKLHYNECDELGARSAIHARRPVIAVFALDDSRWNQFSIFYRSQPDGTLTANAMRASAGGSLGGHAAVLVRCNDTSLTFMNSWGPKFGNSGFFSVDTAATLGIVGGPRMRFYDIYWTIDDLSSDEILEWKKYETASVNTLLGALPTKFHDLPIDCPCCRKSAPARDYDGTWNEARCKTCKQTFTPTVAALIRSLYESTYEAA